LQSTSPDNRLARHNVAILAFAQAVLGSQLSILIILGGLAGARLADNAALATLPISLAVLTSMFSAPLISLFMGRFGRRAGFLLGALFGSAGGALSAWSLLLGHFGLLLAGSICFGVYQSSQGFFRFAAADTASEDFMPKAISWVLAGGLASAFIGPEVVRTSSDLLAPIPFAGAYLMVVLINAVGATGLLWLRIPLPQRRAEQKDTGRSLAEIFSQPTIMVAVLCAMVSYALMSLVMTSTPLAMSHHGMSTGQAADVVRYHVLAMFAPSFVTGSLIARFGHGKVIAFGLLLLAACGVIATAGVELMHFYGALIALGVGWNFGFIGATSLLATAHTSVERAKVQGLNDFLVFGLVAFASFSSGALLNSFGWYAVQYAMIPALTAAAISLAWLALHRRTATRPA